MADIAQIPVTDVADDAVMLDVREPDEYAAGRAPGAISFPMGQIREHLAEVPEGTPLLVICRSGGRSGLVCEYLASQGRDVANVAGGHLAWAQAGKPLDSDADTPDVIPPAQPPEMKV